MYVIRKIIYECNYYWNVKGRKWEGLIENGTQFLNQEIAAEYMRGWHIKSDETIEIIAA